MRWAGALRSDEIGSFGAASFAVLPFAAASGMLAVLAPHSEAQLRVADPLIRLLGPAAPGLTVAAATAVALAWRPIARVVRRDLTWALYGAAAAAVAALGLRLLFGPHLPAFVPPEESSGPGIALGLAAGVLEEVVFRCFLLPGIYASCRTRMGRRAATVAAVVASGVLFSLSHELGPGGGAFEPRFLLTRFVVPGAMMSALAFRPGPTFIVTAHCTAHLLIPFLFQPGR